MAEPVLSNVVDGNDGDPAEAIHVEDVDNIVSECRLNVTAIL